MGNILFPEEDFEEFKSYCRREGFDLSYYSSEITGSLREIEKHRFGSPKVIKLKKKRFGYDGIPYSVSEWQQEQWHHRLADIVDKFREFHKTGLNC